MGLEKRKGNVIEDSRDGIYHFNIGSDVGLLKKMNFSKVMNSKIKDALIYRSLQLGDAEQQLAIPFNTDLVLIGNPLFIPGMFFYVDPTLTGLGRREDPTSLAGKMFLGGYHTVNTVFTQITPEKYETTIKGTQTGLGIR